MAARVIWKGHISFGLVQIPVGLYTATQDKDLSFHLYDRRDHAPVGYKKINKVTGEEISSEDIVKGVEVEDGQMVELSPEEIEAAAPESTQSIDIVGFVDRAELEPRWYVRPYYLVPTKKSSKAYALLREVMRRTDRVGIAKVVLRTRQYLAAVYPHEDVLVAELLRYGDEIRDWRQFELPERDLKALGVTDRELDMAEKLVHGLEEEWHPEQYHDEFREQVQAIIDEKARTGAVTSRRPAIEEEGAEIVDIMSLLKRSVAATGGKAAGGAKAGKSYEPKQPGSAAKAAKGPGKAAKDEGKAPKKRAGKAS